MTVQVQTIVNSYTSAGGSTFVYGFQILNSSHLVVSVNGVVKTLGSDYAVTGVGVQAGGTITGLATSNGDKVLLYRNVPLSRTVDYQTNGDFRATTVNPDFDLLWMMAQQLDERSNRALTLEVGSTASVSLPTPVANYFLGWDGLGAAIINIAGLASAAISAAMQPIVNAATLVAARIGLGAAAMADLRGFIDGFQISPAGGTATLPITAGAAADSTTSWIIQGAASSKTTSNWVVGSGNGGKAQAAAIANNTWYYIYAMYRPDTGVTDHCFSTHATGLTGDDFVAGGGNIPDAYTKWAYIGARKTDGSAQWIACTQIGRKVIWTVVANIGTTISTTANRSLLTIPVPPARLVTALVRTLGGGTAAGAMLFTSPFESDQALTVYTMSFRNNTVAGSATLEIDTNTGQIGHRTDTALTNFGLGVYGWIDNCGADQ